jgi:hypothetical protein
VGDVRQPLEDADVHPHRLLMPPRRLARQLNSLFDRLVRLREEFRK